MFFDGGRPKGQPEYAISRSARVLVVHTIDQSLPTASGDAKLPYDPQSSQNNGPISQNREYKQYWVYHFRHFPGPGTRDSMCVYIFIYMRLEVGWLPLRLGAFLNMWSATFVDYEGLHEDACMLLSKRWSMFHEFPNSPAKRCPPQVLSQFSCFTVTGSIGGELKRGW